MGEGGGYGRGGSSITSAPKPSSLAPPGDQSPARLGMVAASRAPVWGEAGSRWSHLKLGPRDQALSPARLFKAAAQNRRGGGAQGPGSGRWEKVSGGVPSPTKRKPVAGARGLLGDHGARGKAEAGSQARWGPGHPPTQVSSFLFLWGWKVEETTTRPGGERTASPGHDDALEHMFIFISL